MNSLFDKEGHNMKLGRPRDNSMCIINTEHVGMATIYATIHIDCSTSQAGGHTHARVKVHLHCAP